ncbi:type IV toxin-antitoxin system AbiEi family antitoxin domain-containing protein [Thermococcus waiotapuensis]|uniref:Type IV toxin-antitoxin system AbiEi family antitoxin n=1 Tax=Thermococcus waiotapuensis TaxID=90909 RepID=A0AAE4T4E6_9EURY|nr:type IV toxin-antitoxin system AbiEi family antitoxin [Thermococcus waiotapuensis]MDV3104691.1 type IV toxin-antitoxin system AbiEi family antitoxin [Thermococcus waiotapuensis]
MNKMTVLRKLMEMGDAFTVMEARNKLGIDGKLLNYYLRELTKEGFLRRLTRGIYAVTPNPSQPPATDEFLLASLIVKPSAIAYWSALNYYGLTEQIPGIAFVQTPRKRGYPREMSIGGQRFKVITVRPHKFFGLDTIKVGRRNISITDPEKTLIDCLDKPQYCGGIIEVMKALRNGSFDRETILEYAEEMRNTAVLKRLGFLSERLGLGLEREIKIHEKSLRSFPLLDPTMPSKGRFDRKWGLRVNVPEDYWGELE